LICPTGSLLLMVPGRSGVEPSALPLARMKSLARLAQYGLWFAYLLLSRNRSGYVPATVGFIVCQDAGPFLL
jgi:hypothetical protein